MTSPGEPDDWEDGEAVKARLRQQVADAQSRASRAQEMRSEIDAVRGRGTSPRREVVATADASGALMDLKLTDEALEFSPTTLAEMILGATGKARRDASEQAIRITSDAFGESSSAVTMMRDEIDRRESARDTGITY